MATPEMKGQSHQPGTDMDEANTSPPPRSDEDQFETVEGSKDEPPKKRRRMTKPNADKKFECTHPGCGKSYSRAEHLYRHQLNHTPKNIYHCDFPDCNRYFVRQDLCVRHRERHTTAGSQLHKRDTFVKASQDQQKSHTNIAPSGGYDSLYESNVPAHTQHADLANPNVRDEYASNTVHHKSSAQQTSGNHYNGSHDVAVSDSQFRPPASRTNTQNSNLQHSRSSSFSNNAQHATNYPPSVWQQRRSSMSHGMSQGMAGQPLSRSMPQSPHRTFSDSSIPGHQSVPYQSSDQYGGSAHMDANYTTQNELGPTAYSTSMHSPTLPRQAQDTWTPVGNQALNGIPTDPYLYSQLGGASAPMDISGAFPYPTFGVDDQHRSPFLLNDEFTAWLFNPSAATADQTNLSPDFISGYPEGMINYLPESGVSQSPPTTVPPHGQMSLNPKMSVSSILDSSSTSSYIMSDNKRHELLDLMQTQFVERTHDAVKKRKDTVFEGDIDSDDHILSLRMMHTYIGSYWYHQHAQLPILHKPTFSADRTPDLLLLAVIAIGAATLDKAYGTELTDSAAEFANFVVWHLRWEIIRDIDFRPPAKLWVFQTLLLIEVYEKMYSSRTLHERAHIHHDSTLTLMRRGSSLVGRSASESPPSLADVRNGKHENGSAPLDNTHADWLRWINAEATRRAAFGAFVLDALHCTMFGHSAKMVAHEMRLPLPCDESLWSAATATEAFRKQMSLKSKGVRPIQFQDGLKRTLNGQAVRTNSFGRTIVMAGLLSVSWHMTQRDLQIASIGPRAANSIGGPDKWKGTLLRAFDNWKRDFDEALAEAAAQAPRSPPRPPNPNNPASLLRPVDDENIFESRTVLHHLAHIAAHVDIVDCQVFAGADRLLSRIVTPKDYNLVREKIEKWAVRASARDAAFYALKFITTVMIPPARADSDEIDGRIYGHASPILPQAYDSDRYIARDDFLLNRPWVLYVSALVVWCYGFALEGPIDPPPREDDFATYEQREKDMREYLDRVAGVRAPDDLEDVQGKNRCLGLLLILKESYSTTRWELTHEAAGLLGNAADKLRGIGTRVSTPIAESKVTKNHGTGKKTNGHMVDTMPLIEYGSTVSAFNTARP